MNDRKVLEIGGADRADFLQGLVTNDVGGLDTGALVYAALLTPQGKYLSDFFLSDGGDAILLDVAATQAGSLMQRLMLYRLRADVTIVQTEYAVTVGTGPAPEGALRDPRHPDLGWRRIVRGPDDTARTDRASWEARRVDLCIPEAGVELIPNESYILEVGFERLNGVDFRKGCYVGQEVTARMKHKTTLKKGLVRVSISGSAPVGTEILTDTGRVAGTLHSQANGAALAYLRLDRADGELTAGDARIRYRPVEGRVG